MEAKVATTALLLLLLTFGAEAKMCKERSRTFKGRCTQNDNCVSICVAENYTGGYCHGVVRRHCICTKKCTDGGGAQQPPESPPEEPPESPPEEPPESPPEEPPENPPESPPARA